MQVRQKIIHLITGLDVGGAEMMLQKLLSRINTDKYDIYVISLTDIGVIGKKIDEMGIPVYSLGMKRGVANPLLLWKLVKLLKKIKPQVLQTWMYHADLIGLVVGKFVRVPKIIWGIHHSNLNPESNKSQTIKIAKICAKLSSWTTKIVCCSEASYRIHRQLGYNRDKMIVIPNGFDLKMFKPDNMARNRIMNNLNIPNDNLIVGHVGRWDVLKDHLNFLKAAKIIKKELNNISFLLCGTNITKDNFKLNSWIRENGLENDIYLLGERNDIEKVISSFDILVSSSKGEGFPNILGESMACEVPCVVTDVGDCAFIVKETGGIVRPNDSEELAKATLQILKLSHIERKEKGIKARNRIETNFELGIIVAKYEKLYQ